VVEWLIELITMIDKNNGIKRRGDKIENIDS
jgi:hypothetical protein